MINEKENINKDLIIQKIIFYILHTFKENNYSNIEYKYIYNFILNNELFKKYLNQRKNKYVYINLLLKNDKKFKRQINNNNIYYINDYFMFNINIENNDNNITHYYKKINKNIYLPYDNLIEKYKIKKSKLLKKTTEIVLNNELNNNKSYIKDISNIENGIIRMNIDKTNNLVIKIEDKKIFSIDVINYNFNISDIYNEYLNILKLYYPFKYFPYNNILLLCYILYIKEDIKMSNYITILLFDKLIFKTSLKYFSLENNKIKTNIYYEFYNNKIKELKYLDYTFIKNYYELIVFNKDKINFTNFMIGLYKLITYLRNKYNRELKNIAMEIYNDNFIKNFVELDNSSIFNNEITIKDIDIR